MDIERPVERRGPDSAFVSGVGFNGAAQVMPLLTMFALTPYLIRTLGLDGFGVWSLLSAFLATLMMLDGGVGASLSRFFALRRAAASKGDIGRLITGSLLLFLVLGVAVSGLGVGLAPLLVSHLKIPQGLRHDSVTVLRSLGPLLFLALATDSATSLLQACDRFRALAGATLISCLVYAVGVLALVRDGHALLMLVVVTAVRYVVLLVVALFLAKGEVEWASPIVPGRALRREFFRYALPMQASALTAIFNGETDALVIGALLPIRYVGLYAVANQAATALRSFPLYAFPPILVRMTTAYHEDGLAGAVDEFHRLQRRWLAGVLGYGAVATAAVSFGIEAWLGYGYRTSGVMAVVLTGAYTVQVAATGIRTCFVRAVGRPGLETRYSLAAMGVNVALTIPFALLFGAVGVVTATALGLVLGSLYFIRLCRQVAALNEQLPSSRWLLATATAAAVTVLGELVVRRIDLHGGPALVLAGLPALVGLALTIVVGGEHLHLAELRRPARLQSRPDGA